MDYETASYDELLKAYKKAQEENDHEKVSEIFKVANRRFNPRNKSS